MKHIFLIEDNPSLVKIYTQRLKREGFEISVASGGTEALKRVRDESPNLIILDLILPGMSGFKVLEKLKENQKTKYIPVIVLTILEQEKDVKEALKLGASSYLFKSETSLDELIEIVKKNLPQE